MLLNIIVLVILLLILNILKLNLDKKIKKSPIRVEKTNFFVSAVENRRKNY